MVDLGMANSRMKDFFDIWFLSQNFDFEGRVLAESLKATFGKRMTPLREAVPLALTQDFAKEDAKQKQWKAFMSRLSKETSPMALSEIIAIISPFLLPPLDAVRTGAAFAMTWNARGPWS